MKKIFSLMLFVLVAMTSAFAQTTGSGTKEDPYTVADVIQLNNPSPKPTNQWVQGYIIGTRSNSDVNALSDNISNVVLSLDATIAETFDATKHITVDYAALESAIEDDPTGYTGVAVKIKGTLEAYFGNPGLKSGSEYELIMGDDFVAAPEFSVASGMFSSTFNLGMKTETEGASIHYILNGDITSPLTVYTDSIAIPAATTTVKAVAINGTDTSDVTEATYTYVDNSALIVYDFGADSVLSSMTSSYDDRTLDYTEATVILENANKQSGTITDMPVTKGGTVTVTLKDATKAFDVVTFNCKQWTTKSQTITLEVSTDGTTFAELSPSVTSNTFAISHTFEAAENYKAVRFVFSSQTNQVGIENFIFTTKTVAVPAVAAPTFSVAAGEYTEAFDLDLSTTTVADLIMIIYTTDGSTPALQADMTPEGTTQGYNVMTPIRVDATMTVKAATVVLNFPSTTYEMSAVSEATYTFPEPMAEVADFDAFETLADTENDVKITGELTAVFQNFKSLYVYDGTDIELIYGDSVKDAGYALVNGQVISNVVGKYSEYNEVSQLVLKTIETIGAVGTPVAPDTMVLADITSSHVNQYVRIENAVFASDVTYDLSGVDNGYVVVNDSTNFIVRSNFHNIDATYNADDVVNIEGFISVFGGKAQIYPTSIEKVVVEPAVAAPTFSVAAGEYTEAFDLDLSTTTVADLIMIIYTTDGSTPALQADMTPEGTTQGYNVMTPIRVDATMTVKAATVVLNFPSTTYEMSAVSEATYTFPEPMAEVADFDAFETLADTENSVRITGEMTVVFHNWRNMYVFDGTDIELMHSPYIDNMDDMANGQVISNVVGKYSVYNEIPQMAVDTVETIGALGTAIAPEVELPADVCSDEMLHQYVRFENAIMAADVTYESGSEQNGYILNGADTMVIRNKFRMIDATFTEGASVNVEGFVSKYDGEYQLYLTEIEAAESVDVEVNGESNAIVYTEANNVVVMAQAGATIQVYSLTGICLYNNVALDNTTTITAMPAGAAIVVVDGEASKVIIK